MFFKHLFNRQIRLFSINKFSLVCSSENIQLILKSIDEKSSILNLFSNSIDQIHFQYSSSKQIATSTKNLYETNSSKLNSLFVQYENQRKYQIDSFDKTNFNHLIILLRYIRFLNLTSIYRLITFDLDSTLKQTTNSIIYIANNHNYFQTNCLSLICELIFFLNYLCSTKSLSQIKSNLSQTLIIDYLFENLNKILIESKLNKKSCLLLKEYCSILNSIVEIPNKNQIEIISNNLLKYLIENRSNEITILKYLILIEHNRYHKKSSSFIDLLNQYLIQCAIYETKLEIVCEILILINSLNYSHELFHKHLLHEIEKQLKLSTNHLIDIQLICRLIYYLCLTDPTNRFSTRKIIIDLSQQIYLNLNEKITSPQWIVQAQHGMMLLNIYNYQLLFSTVQQQFFPLLFRDLGVYSLTIHRQLFDIHHSLICDRPQIKTRLLNNQMIEYASKISNEYRLSIESNQKSYFEYLNQLNDLFIQIYGKDSCKIISTIQHIPNLIFHFLEINLPDQDYFKSIGLQPKQRIAIVPILKSMLIKQQRANGNLIRLLNAQTMMRCRIIQNENYRVLTMFHDEYIRAQRRNQFKSMFETKLALKTLPDQSYHI